MAPPKLKRLCSSKKQQRTPNTQTFLNSLSMAEAEVWNQEIYGTNVYLDQINHLHLPTTLTVDQLQSLKSITHHDGEKVVEVFQFFSKYYFYFRNFFQRFDAMQN
jgi:hypothetical protein